MKLRWFVIALAILAFNSGLSAQEKEREWIIRDSSNLTDPVNLDGITVSGEKRAGLIREVPASMTALSFMRMEQDRVLRLTDLTALVPNLFMPDYGSRLTSPIYIRGIGSRINTPSIGLYVDEVASFEKSGFNFDLLDIKQIEVLRGPQGTLYGRNTMGGIIHVITNPIESYRSTQVGAEYAGYGIASLRFSHNQPILQDKLGLQLAGQYRQRKGFFINDFTESQVDKQNSGSGRVKLNYKHSDRLNAGFTMNFERSREGGYPYAIVKDDVIQPIAYDHVSTYNRDMLSSSLKLASEWNRLELVSITGYQFVDDLQDIDQDFTPANLLAVIQDQSQHLITQEIQLRSKNSEKVEWITGLYGFSQLIDRVVDVAYLEGAVPVFRLPGMMNKVKYYEFNNVGAALFGQAKIKDLIFNGLDLVLGARLDQETDRLAYNYILAMNGAEIPQDEFDYGFDFLEFLPKMALQYRVSSRLNTYASIGKGYKSGGFNSTIERPEDESYRSEYSWNYEIGVKTGTSDGRYIMNLAGFYIDWTDQQIYQPVPSGQGSMLKNAGESRSLGFEIEALAKPVRNLTANFSMGYTSAKFLDYLRDESKGINFRGNSIPYVPVYTYYAGLTYRIPLYEKLIDELSFNINSTGTGRIFWDDENTLTQDPYQLVNLRADYHFKGFTIGLWARNILDKNYTAFQFTALGNQYAQPGNPRLAGLSFSTRF